MHYEWVWDGGRLCVVQQDREEPREGPRPGAFDRRSGQQAIDDFRVLLRADRSLGAWHKTECLRVFAGCRLPPSMLYVAEGDWVIRRLAGGQPDPGLVADLRRLGEAPIVVRTDVAKTLPTTRRSSGGPTALTPNRRSRSWPKTPAT